MGARKGAFDPIPEVAPSTNDCRQVAKRWTRLIALSCYVVTRSKLALFLSAFFLDEGRKSFRIVGMPARQRRAVLDNVGGGP